MSDLGSFGAPSTATFGEESAKSESSSEQNVMKSPALPAVAEVVEKSVQENLQENLGAGSASVEITEQRRKPTSRNASPFQVVTDSARVRQLSQSITASSAGSGISGLAAPQEPSADARLDAEIDKRTNKSNMDPNTTLRDAEDKGPRSSQQSDARACIGAGLGVTPGVGLPGVVGRVASAPGGPGEEGGKSGGADGQQSDARACIGAGPLAAASPGAGSVAKEAGLLSTGLVTGGAEGGSVAKDAGILSAGSSLGGGAGSAAASWARRVRGGTRSASIAAIRTGAVRDASPGPYKRALDDTQEIPGQTKRNAAQIAAVAAAMPVDSESSAGAADSAAAMTYDVSYNLLQVKMQAEMSKVSKTKFMRTGGKGNRDWKCE